MRLMRWLSAGKSLVGMQENVGRYQMTHERLLPDFSADRARPGAPAESSRGTEEEVPVQKTQMNSEMNTTQTAGRGAGIWQSVTGFFSRLLPRRTMTEKTRQPVVQGELSLDSVKVMRNDLSDSDLEVVTKRPVTERPQIAHNAVATLKQTAGELMGMGKS